MSSNQNSDLTSMKAEDENSRTRDSRCPLHQSCMIVTLARLAGLSGPAAISAERLPGG
jgi:hypothetical protein